MGTRTNAAPRHQSSMPKMQRFEEEYAQGEDDEDEVVEEKRQSPRPRRRKRAGTYETTVSDGSGGRQEVIMRLPFTTWMNHSAKSRESIIPPKSTTSH